MPSRGSRSRPKPTARSIRSTHEPLQVAAARVQIDAEGDQLDAQLTGAGRLPSDRCELAVFAADDRRDFALARAGAAVVRTRSVAGERPERTGGGRARRRQCDRRFECQARR